MHGIITTNVDTIYVTPLKKGHAETYAKRNKKNSDKMHLIYKRNVDDHRYCDVEPPTSRDGETMTLETMELVENSYIPPKYVEMCLILDKDFVANHMPDHEMYALTLLNIVSRRYTEPSLDVSVRIFIVRMIVLDSDNPTVDGQSFFINRDLVLETLLSLGTWEAAVNPEGDDDPGHWDNILTLSGKDLTSSTSGSALLGLAFIAGTCISQRGVSINEDFGLTTGIVAAHELGHTLTLAHDQDEGCEPGFVMGSSIRNGENIFKWSSCSRMNLKAYFRIIDSACLNDVPSGLLSPLETTDLPGKTITWEEQCSLLGYTSSCNLPIDCDALKCLSEDGTCYFLLSHATAEGTSCGIDMVCLAGECVAESAVPVPVDGGWSEWTESPCSRTCGGGVIIRERACNNPTPVWGGAFCEGEGFEPRLCNTDSCSVSPDGYRDEQCAAAASVPDFDGMVYGWTSYFVTFLDFTDYCKNPCLRSDNMFWARRPPGLNEDGTECWDYNVGDESVYLRCVRGFCLEFGCDGLQGSSKEFDVCRVCNGGGTSCTCETGSFTTGTTGTTGTFNFFHEIPSGATSILITNDDLLFGTHVAIATVDGDLFRGSGTSPSSSIRVAIGSFIIRHAVGTSEVFRSTGPSTHLLRLEVYLNSAVQTSITYKYYLPRAEITYFWDEDDWGSCSQTCGDGIEMRVVTCRSVENGITSDSTDDLCETNVGTKPDTVRSCNDGPCPNWNAGGFGSCDATCGEGMETQTVTCRQGDMVVDDSMCDAATKPPTEQPCNVGDCVWSTGSFGPCSVTCGTGTQTRTVECTNNNGVVPDVNCDADSKPDTTQSCEGPICPDWSIDVPFGDCDATCGEGMETQTVTCRQGDMVVDDSMCDAATKPPTEQPCNVGDCVWSTGSFGPCSVTCGTGTQTRTVECTNDNGVVPDVNCDADSKPDTTQSCEGPICPDWSIDVPFGDCDATCGEGMETQTVTCRQGDMVVDDSMCDAATKPPTEQPCNVGDCVWSTGSFGPCSVTCGTGTQTRTVECTNDNGVVPDVNCDADSKPDTTQSCEGPICPDWSIDVPFGDCDATCGEGMETQTVTCRQGDMVVDDSMCDAATKPPTEQPCNVGDCVWSTGSFGPCSVTCGTGTQTRTVECTNDNGVVPDVNCDADSNPDTNQSCEGPICPDWSIDVPFGDCDATCGEGMETQTVTCRQGDMVVDDSMCDAATKPPTEQPCNVGDCVWSTGSFGPCSVTCGTGTQTRTVECTNDDGVVPDVNCDVDLKPVSSQECNDGPCGSAYWFTGPFRTCSIRCGIGIQTRQVYCQIGSVRVEDSFCEEDNRPTTTQECISRQCTGCDSVFVITDKKRSGTFSTPRFPKVYPANSRCTTWLAAEEGKRIRISFRRFQLQASIRRNCLNDRLTITDLVTGNEERLCGVLGRFTRIYNHQVMLFFRSNRRRNFRGFRAIYTAF
ncbi:A disintegrin and metalloproteinase with thrombospondin motifs 20 [Holothuria leucospilota]|uniref:A disintegrin and metalloproteinase with thrombospondin motifs 20 n=1 Tax=Holothuria leucospilota TaxID=206669 RepID=A0A9Q1B9N2_HOLLE|nr:A disintegrin and metalloproteinase with thrombospondin motifs 20 [Holothuria leucospilota]